MRAAWLRPLSLALAQRVDLQGGVDPSKKSGVGVDFELLVRSLQVRNKRALRKPSLIYS